jgi:hypothetical protein
MLAVKIMKDLSFSDMGRLLQRTNSDNTTAGSEGENYNVAAACMFGFIMLVITICACVAMREIIGDHVLSELPGDDTVLKTIKSTLADRKRAIVQLFETSDVTMVSQEQPWDSKRQQNKQFTRNIRKLTMSFPTDGDKGRYSSWSRRWLSKRH